MIIFGEFQTLSVQHIIKPKIKQTSALTNLNLDISYTYLKLPVP